MTVERQVQWMGSESAVEISVRTRQHGSGDGNECATSSGKARERVSPVNQKGHVLDAVGQDARRTSCNAVTLGMQ